MGLMDRNYMRRRPARWLWQITWLCPPLWFMTGLLTGVWLAPQLRPCLVWLRASLLALL